MHVQLGFIVAGVRNNLESPQSLFLQGENVMHFNRAGEKNKKKNQNVSDHSLALDFPPVPIMEKKGRLGGGEPSSLVLQ